MIKNIINFFFKKTPETKPEEHLNKYKNWFGTKALDPSEEHRWKTKIFDMSMDPREWMARHGHRIFVGDFRVYKFKDKGFEKWIHKAFEALTSEGLEKLWEEFLTEEEILKIREEYNNP